MADLFSYEPDKYPHTPGYSERDTSKAAAESVKSVAGELQRKCLAALKTCPMTADEISGFVGETVLSIRPRVTELAKLEKIVDTGRRRKNDSGRSAKVWRLA